MSDEDQSPKISWTLDMRIVLLLLYKHFSKHGQSSIRTAVFNAMFKDELAECGLPEGATKTTLGSQYTARVDKRLKEKRRYDPWPEARKRLSDESDEAVREFERLVLEKGNAMLQSRSHG